MELKSCEMPLKIAICEDNPKDAESLSSFIENCGIPHSLEVFCKAEDLMALFQPCKYDLIFFDIYMDALTGVEAAARIRETDSFVSLVFTTTSLDHTLESYRLGAIKYLEKPLTEKAVKDTLKISLGIRDLNCLSVFSEGKTINIPLPSVIYFELRNRYVTAVTTGGIIRISQLAKLSDIEKMLPDNFFRCHHSYIVNFSYVRKLEKELSSFLMENGDHVHIRRQDKKKAIEAYEDYLFGMSRKAGALRNEQEA